MTAAAPASQSAWPPGLPLKDGALPRITVVTPNFNGAAFLERTIRSVLDQRYPNLEYIVIDGASTDGSAAIIERYRGELAHAIIEPDEGHYDAIAKGFARGTGEIFAWLNSDDIYMPWTLRTVAQIFSAHAEVEWISGLPASLHEGAIRKVEALRPWPREWIALGLFRQDGLGFIQQESTFWRADLYRKSGGFDAGLKLAGDFDLWRRFAAHAELVAVSSVFGGFSYHGDNRGILQREAYAAEIEQLFSRQSSARAAEGTRLLNRLRTQRRRLRRWPQLRAVLDLQSLFSHGAAGPVLTWDWRDSAYHLSRQTLPLRAC